MNMNKGIITSGIIGMLCIGMQSMAADSDRAVDHDALRVLRDKIETSLNAGNMQDLRTCLAKDFTFITSDQTVLTNWTDVVAYWDEMLKNEKSPITAMTTEFTADILTQFSGPDIGYCRGTSKDVYTLRNKRKIAMQNTWSAMLVKEQDGWKISAAHVAVNFLDNPVLTARGMSWLGKLGVGLHMKKLPGEIKE